MRFWHKMEIEWKILILGCLVFIAFAWPVQKLFISRLTDVLIQSIDPNLEPLLRSQLASGQEQNKPALVAGITRNRQWEALIPIIVKEQRRIIFSFSLVLFSLLFILALWTLKRFTKPLKQISRAVDKIGKGEKVAITPVSGGALGTLEQAMCHLQEELDILREKTRIQGMETAWQDIARVMAHEIKNPLTPIRLTLDRIEDKIAEHTHLPPEELQKYCTRINVQIDILERLVNQFRSFSREPEVHLSEVLLADALQTIADGMAPSITTTIDCPGILHADPYLLHQILLNIWKNSLEAGATTILVRSEKEQNTLTMFITDNGPGIAREDLERVWLPYVTLKKGGTGLGLAVVRKLVETMHGTVSLHSDKKQGKGVTVVLSLPCFTKGETLGK
jgi:nitrogen fixation/metabolism regulation signal transduction histidine kinase